MTDGARMEVIKGSWSNILSINPNGFDCTFNHPWWTDLLDIISLIAHGTFDILRARLRSSIFSGGGLADRRGDHREVNQYDILALSPWRLVIDEVPRLIGPHRLWGSEFSTVKVPQRSPSRSLNVFASVRRVGRRGPAHYDNDLCTPKIDDENGINWHIFNKAVLRVWVISRFDKPQKNSTYVVVRYPRLRAKTREVPSDFPINFCRVISDFCIGRL